MIREADDLTAGRYPATAGPERDSQASLWHGSGFTLVELLTVVSIISLLLLIGTPSALVIQKRVAIGISQVTLGTIETALKNYRSDFDEYPPSSMDGGGTICRLLTGYTEDRNNDQTPGVGAGFNSDDGHKGFGFRLVTRGRIFGPYSGTEKLPIASGTPPRFADAFRQPVLYYLYRSYSASYGTYNDRDNTEGPAGINDYATSASASLYRKDFLLITCGPDREWTKPRNRGGDDITNFK